MKNEIKLYLDKCASAYYAGQPIITDEVFDRLASSIGYDELGAKQHAHLRKHLHPMYSLKKVYRDENKNPLADEQDVVYSPKIDGAALDLLYIDGKYAQAVTRGDGVEGTDVTDKFADPKLVPQLIHHEGLLQITGELAAPKTVENSRNYAAGALNLKEVSEFKTRAVIFIAYGMSDGFQTYTDDMRWLESQGFTTIMSSNLVDIYPCDGMVYRVNNNARFKELGYTSTHPHGAYALKDRGETVDTRIIDVEWNTGKSGKVTPVAILEPVYIGDKLVSRATLNNIAFIEALDIQIGDMVAVGLGGEIIPVIYHKVE